MEGLALLAYLWFLHLCVAFTVSLPFWFFGRHRAQWFKWEPIILVVPFAVWATLSVIDGGGKSLTNAAVEGISLGGAIPVAAMIRVAVGGRLNRKKLAITMIVLLSLAAVLLWALVPMLPE
jgi:hypothetical protein